MLEYNATRLNIQNCKYIGYQMNVTKSIREKLYKLQNKLVNGRE